MTLHTTFADQGDPGDTGPLAGQCVLLQHKKLELEQTMECGKYFKKSTWPQNLPNPNLSDMGHACKITV